MSLSNGARFPNYVFKHRPLHIRFFEFNQCFLDDFIQAFSEYSRKLGVVKITINNIEPAGLVFNHTIDTDKFSINFAICARTPLEYYAPSDAHFYMMTEIAEIFPADNEDQFTLILDRNFDVGILGAKSASSLDIFDNFRLGDMQEYISAYLGPYFTNEQEDRLKRNYLT
jgi:hypothetical protein